MEKSTKGKRRKITLEVKKEIISKFENGGRMMDLSKEYGMPRTTISTIIKNKGAIKEADVAKGVTTLTKRRPQSVEEMEKLLLIWIREKRVAGDSISESSICEKALRLHADIVANSPGGSPGADTFKASHGWFDNFKKRTGIRSVLRHGESAGANQIDAGKFVLEFKNYVTAQDFVPQQVFNCGETGLFWKKMPKRTFITQEERALPSLGMSGVVMEELLKAHKTELTTDELKSILVEQEKAAGETEPVSSSEEEEEEEEGSPSAFSSEEEGRPGASSSEEEEEEGRPSAFSSEEEEEEEEEGRPCASTSQIKEMIAKWDDVQAFLETFHPDRDAVSHVTSTVNDLAMPYFEQILRRQQKQISIEGFLVRKRSGGAEPGGSSAKKARQRLAGQEPATREENPRPASKQ